MKKIKDIKSIKAKRKIAKIFYDLYFNKGIRFIEHEDGTKEELNGNRIYENYVKYFGN
ncbi:hypothetical protein STFE110948_02870 [Streptobacillus felis]|uniref:hypothetical protein n=1 Tax=Streptobacillus felis TaxID=1384509 RepID=UPI000AD59E0C|nr:hypothetical protein [Streptobacillus felis]